MRLPDRIGPYEIEARLGQGGMGLVYQARDPDLRRAVALKVLSPELLTSDKARTRFQREAEALAKVAHPHVVRVHAAGVDDDRPWIALDLVAGGSLESRLDEGPVTPREAATLVAQVADAVEHVHRAGILHRDIKPDNVLIDEEGHPRLTDFGLARGLSGELTRLSRTGAASGTPGYMAPEQVRGAEDLGPGVDVYGLGSLLYTLLTGSPPFGGTPMEVIVATLERVPDAPSRFRPELPPALDAICLRCLAKAPAARYPSAAALAADLQRFLAGTWTPPRRFGARLAVAATAVVLAAGAGAAASLIRAPARADPVDSPATQPEAKPRETQDPREELRALETLPPDVAAPGLLDWIGRYPDHALVARARERLADLAKRPLWTETQSPPVTPEGVPYATRLTLWAPERVIVWYESREALIVRHLRTGERLGSLTSPGPLQSVFPLDSERIVVGQSDGALAWLEEGQPARVVQAFTERDLPPDRGWDLRIEALALDADGRVWAGSACGWIRGFDVETGAPRGELHAGDPVRTLLVPAAERRLVSASGWAVKVTPGFQDPRAAPHSMTLWSLDHAVALQTESIGWRPKHLARTPEGLLLADGVHRVLLYRLTRDRLEADGHLGAREVRGARDRQFLEGTMVLDDDIHAAVTHGAHVLVGGEVVDGSGVVKAWRLPAREEQASWRFPTSATGVALGQDLFVVGLRSGRLEAYMWPTD